jgi:hypothetical protein
VPFDFGRFTATVTTRRRTAKSTGRPYFEATATIKPSTMDEISQLSTYFADRDKEQTALATKQAYESRVRHLRSLIRG